MEQNPYICDSITANNEVIGMKQSLDTRPRTGVIKYIYVMIISRTTYKLCVLLICPMFSLMVLLIGFTLNYYNIIMTIYVLYNVRIFGKIIYVIYEDNDCYSAISWLDHCMFILHSHGSICNVNKHHTFLTSNQFLNLRH